MVVYRLRCPKCNRTFGVLPAFVRPYGRYVTLLHEALACGRVHRRETLDVAQARLCARGQGVSRRTAQRWWSQLKRRAPMAVDHLAEAIVRLDPSVNPMDLAAEAAGVGGVVGVLLRLGAVFRQQCWGRTADRRAWSVGLFGLCNAQDWAIPML